MWYAWPFSIFDSSAHYDISKFDVDARLLSDLIVIDHNRTL